MVEPVSPNGNDRDRAGPGRAWRCRAIDCRQRLESRLEVMVGIDLLRDDDREVGPVGRRVGRLMRDPKDGSQMRHLIA